MILGLTEQQKRGVKNKTLHIITVFGQNPMSIWAKKRGMEVPIAANEQLKLRFSPATAPLLVIDDVEDGFFYTIVVDKVWLTLKYQGRGIPYRWIWEIECWPEITKKHKNLTMPKKTAKIT